MGGKWKEGGSFYLALERKKKSKMKGVINFKIEKEESALEIFLKKYYNEKNIIWRICKTNFSKSSQYTS
jgi:hypothetical protein